uniref:Uncharacterized protein n=1 Tax=Brugia malayi TaxID=6279 RepID=A0A7I4KD17_BRUMA
MVYNTAINDTFLKHSAIIESDICAVVYDVMEWINIQITFSLFSFSANSPQ